LYRSSRRRRSPSPTDRHASQRSHRPAAQQSTGVYFFKGNSSLKAFKPSTSQLTKVGATPVSSSKHGESMMSKAQKGEFDFLNGADEKDLFEWEANQE
jgi:hypothetical protein